MNKLDEISVLMQEHKKLKKSANNLLKLTIIFAVIWVIGFLFLGHLIATYSVY
jgi:preprotein translocase subunit SecG